MARWQFRRALDFDVRVYSDLHARVGIDRSENRDELVQAILTIFLGNAIVLIPMILNAHAGTRYGIPFPVYCRAAFGTKGANIPALLRAFVACGWFGIQTWIGGNASASRLLLFFILLEKN